jgi:TolB-like protein/Tfp pilus assembly protein PilF
MQSMGQKKGSQEEVAPTLLVAGTPVPTTASSPSDDTGPVLRTKIGPYVIDGVIGAGGMGVVYGARDPKLDRKVAIKVLRAREHDSSEYQRLRLLREARAMAKLSHPNVVTVFGADVDAEEIYFAMELVDGTTLRQWLATPRTWQEIIRVFIGAGRGLAAAHAVGLVHRDFKPDNVLIDTSERARVSDFGIASETSGQSHEQGQIVGTPRYMSPEQYGAAPIDARSDQYSFCLVLYEALFNAHAFAFSSLNELMSRVLLGERAPVPSSDTPDWIRRVIDRGLSLDAGARFPSMTSLVDELERNLTVGALPIPDKPSIAVLPFHNLSGDPEQEHFADAVVESITAVLSRIRSFFVISRNSAFRFRGRDRNPREIGRELGVAYLLDGSVQRVGARVRITVQLSEAASGLQLWADKYDGTLDEVFDLQDRITEHVAGALQPSIRHAEIERARRKRPVELGAYDYTMRAMHHVWHLEKAHATQGLELLDRALTVDPKYPLALALRAWCLAQHSVYNWVDNATSVLAKALELADTAANLSADDPVVLAVLGTVHTFARNHGVARVMLERAVSLDPNNAWALSRLGWLDVYADQPAPAATHFEKALRLSPFDPMNFNNYVGLASSKQVAGDDNGAADLFMRALQERPNALWIHRNLAPALFGAGRQDEAMRSRDAMLAAYPDLTVRKYKAVMVFSPRVLARIADQLSALGIPDGES